MVRFLGLFAIIPATIFLTVSFFVIFTLSKVTSKALKDFGMTVVILLWISALLVFSLGIYTVVTGKHPMMQMHKAMMRDMMMQRSGAMAPMGTMPNMPAMPRQGTMPQGMMNHR